MNMYQGHLIVTFFVHFRTRKHLSDASLILQGSSDSDDNDQWDSDGEAAIG